MAFCSVLIGRKMKLSVRALSGFRMPVTRTLERRLRRSSLPIFRRRLLAAFAPSTATGLPSSAAVNSLPLLRLSFGKAVSTPWAAGTP